jgi:hypothetical protein
MEETSDGLKIHTTGYRNGNKVFSKQVFNMENNDVYIKWLKHNGAKYMRGSIGITNTEAKLTDLEGMAADTWLYTHIRINSDKSVIAITCINDYDDATIPGTQVNSNPTTITNENWYNVKNGNIYAYFDDTYDPFAYLTIGEVKIKNATPITLYTKTAYIFADGTIPTEFVTNGAWSIDNTVTTTGNSLYIAGNVDDSLSFTVTNAAAVRIKYKISHNGGDSSPLPETATSIFFKRNNTLSLRPSVYANGRTEYNSDWCSFTVPANQFGVTEFTFLFTVKNGQKLWIDEIKVEGTDGGSSEGDALLTENFDSETFPPTGWTQTILNSSNTWTLGNLTNNLFTDIDATNVYSALCAYVAEDQNEWLKSPVFALQDGIFTLEFYAGYSTSWLSAATLKLNISVNGGSDWTKIWEADNDGQGWIWRKISLDLSSYANNANVMLGWQYVGNDGDWVGIDNVKITQGTTGIFEQKLEKDNIHVQNYPNPFSSQTTIAFQLENSKHINLIIYNSLGQKIVELLNGELNSGNHQFTFDAIGLKSGIYYYRFIVDGISTTRPMILSK